MRKPQSRNVRLHGGPQNTGILRGLRLTRFTNLQYILNIDKNLTKYICNIH